MSQQPDSPRQDRLRPERLENLSLGVFAGYAVAVLVMAASAVAGLETESSVRAYVKGESLWTKAQKEAFFALDEYAAGGAEADWARYLDRLRVPLGFRRARVQLQSSDPDWSAARAGFREGGLEPDEIDGAVRLYRWLGWWDPLEEAVEQWAAGDSLIAEMHAQAAVLRREFEPPPPDTQVVIRAMSRAEALNDQLAEAEQSFTDTFSGIARVAYGWALWSTVGLTLLLLVGGGGLAYQVFRVTRGRETALRRAEARYRRIFEDSQDAIYMTRRDGTIMEMNSAGVELFGYDRDTLFRMSARELYHDPADRQEFQRRIDRDGQVDDFEVRLETRDGRVLDCQLTATARIEDDEVVGYQGIIRDVTERKRFEQELEEQALHDSLTGLPNRALLWDRLEQGLARSTRDAGHLAVLFLDLDRFKAVNDSFSHTAGDRVLVQVASRLTGSVREPDTVARVGGDEFVVLVEDLEAPDEAASVARRIADAFEPPFPVDGEEVHLDVSVGIAPLGAELAEEDASASDVADELVRRADQAMYRAKRRTGTRVHRYEAEGPARLPRIQEENELRRALEEEEFVLHYQPIVELPEGRIVAVEPLVRWRHPGRGLVPPADFLPLAEETGLILRLGAWVVERACHQVAEWNGSLRPSEPLLLHPNLSPTQFEDPGLIDRLEEILEATALPPECLEVEVTEHSVMQAPARSRALAGLGVGVCIDDFGTGYSSLSYVKELAADGLKIDMSFVHGIGSSREDEAIIRAILTLGNSLGLKVVGEGVETDEQRRWLEEAGCRKLQGYYFAEPEPAEAFEDRLREDGASAA